ncbi:ATP-binding protein [Evtepia sp.]|uniref:ATP-binding protein n=1 Tax=Evtepia sp. TaxID=2773933 RepID=UPI002A82D50E|nr:ATP-binding protein [Evtepia sp.]MDY4429638.1 ATP-binding protein [Evtepia sp.]
MPLDFTGNAFSKKPKTLDNTSMPPSPDRSKKEAESTIWLPSKPKYKLDDLILDESVKESLMDVISFYSYQDKVMNEWGLRERYADHLSLSINLYGESGTGKTMAAHAIAHELNKEILFVDYAEIESKYVGETAKNIKQLFVAATEMDAIIIFDEADALLSRRVTDMRSSSDVSVNQTRSVLLNILNDYTGVVIFTTNFIQNFDPAFIRRIRYQIKFELPNEKLRAKLWRMYIPSQMPTDVDFDRIANKYAGVSGSDISNAVFSAAIKAARTNSDIVEVRFFENAIEQIIQAKKANTGMCETITKRVVSEEYVKEQLGMEE